MGKTKTAITAKDKIAIIITTAAIAKKKIAASMKIVVRTKTVAVIETVDIKKIIAVIKIVIIVIKAPKIFRIRAIIIAKEKTIIIGAKTIKKQSITSFNKREKYIWINSNIAIFA